MLCLTWLTVAQHVFQPALTGRLELISWKIISCKPGTKAIAVSRFREKLSPANWVQGVTAISRKISRSWAPKKWGPTCDRDISNSAIYATAIYRAYTVLQQPVPSHILIFKKWEKIWKYNLSLSRGTLFPSHITMMTSWHANTFHITGLFRGESAGVWWIALTKGQ